MRIWAARFHHPLRSRHRDTGGDYSFPLPGDDGKGKTPVDKRRLGKRAKLTARRA